MLFFPEGASPALLFAERPHDAIVSLSLISHNNTSLIVIASWKTQSHRWFIFLNSHRLTHFWAKLE